MFYIYFKKITFITIKTQYLFANLPSAKYSDCCNSTFNLYKICQVISSMTCPAKFCITLNINVDHTLQVIYFKFNLKDALTTDKHLQPCFDSM